MISYGMHLRETNLKKLNYAKENCSSRLEGVGDSSIRGWSAVAMVNMVEEKALNIEQWNTPRGMNIVKDQLLGEGQYSDRQIQFDYATTE